MAGETSGVILHNEVKSGAIRGKHELFSCPSNINPKFLIAVCLSGVAHGKPRDASVWSLCKFQVIFHVGVFIDERRLWGTFHR